MKQISENQELSARESLLVHHATLYEYYRSMENAARAQVHRDPKAPAKLLIDAERYRDKGEFHLHMVQQIAAALGPPFDPEPALPLL